LHKKDQFTFVGPHYHHLTFINSAQCSTVHSFLKERFEALLSDKKVQDKRCHFCQEVKTEKALFFILGEEQDVSNTLAMNEMSYKLFENASS
jgi:hypothetical protein